MTLGRMNILEMMCKLPWPHLLAFFLFFAILTYWELSRAARRFCQITGNYVEIERQMFYERTITEGIERNMKLLKAQTSEGACYRRFLQLESAWEKFCGESGYELSSSD